MSHCCGGLLRSHTACLLQCENSINAVVWCCSSFKSWELGKLINTNLRGRCSIMGQLRWLLGKHRYISPCSKFCSLQVLCGLNDMQSQSWGKLINPGALSKSCPQIMFNLCTLWPIHIDTPNYPWALSLDFSGSILYFVSFFFSFYDSGNRFRAITVHHIPGTFLSVLVLFWGRVSCSDWSWTCDFPASASHSAKITRIISTASLQFSILHLNFINFFMV